jgi:hypothetical protein
MASGAAADFRGSAPLPEGVIKILRKSLGRQSQSIKEVAFS